jgi:hypothetical protein
MNHKQLEELWSELEAIKNLDRLIVLIDEDRKKKSPEFKILAETDPQRLFEHLGGDESDISECNWAFEYTYDNYISDYELDFDKTEADQWNLEEESIKHAHETGHWYVTGICTIKSDCGIELDFEFDYCEGYLVGIIGTPYDEENHGNHGYMF